MNSVKDRGIARSRYGLLTTTRLAVVLRLGSRVFRILLMIFLTETTGLVWKAPLIPSPVLLISTEALQRQSTWAVNITLGEVG